MRSSRVLSSLVSLCLSCVCYSDSVLSISSSTFGGSRQAPEEASLGGVNHVNVDGGPQRDTVPPSAGEYDPGPAACGEQWTLVSPKRRPREWEIESAADSASADRRSGPHEPTTRGTIGGGARAEPEEPQRRGSFLSRMRPRHLLGGIFGYNGDKEDHDAMTDSVPATAAVPISDSHASDHHHGEEHHHAGGGSSSSPRACVTATDDNGRNNTADYSGQDEEVVIFVTVADFVDSESEGWFAPVHGTSPRQLAILLNSPPRSPRRRPRLGVDFDKTSGDFVGPASEGGDGDRSGSESPSPSLRGGVRRAIAFAGSANREKAFEFTVQSYDDSRRNEYRFYDLVDDGSEISEREPQPKLAIATNKDKRELFSSSLFSMKKLQSSGGFRQADISTVIRSGSLADVRNLVQQWQVQSMFENKGTWRIPTEKLKKLLRQEFEVAHLIDLDACVEDEAQPNVLVGAASTMYEVEALSTFSTRESGSGGDKAHAGKAVGQDCGGKMLEQGGLNALNALKLAVLAGREDVIELLLAGSSALGLERQTQIIFPAKPVTVNLRPRLGIPGDVGPTAKEIAKERADAMRAEGRDPREDTEAKAVFGIEAKLHGYRAP